ncbi:hypothetical protein HK102_008309, partial [Quaeritorhiza haematococci]
SHPKIPIPLTSSPHTTPNAIRRSGTQLQSTSTSPSELQHAYAQLAESTHNGHNECEGELSVRRRRSLGGLERSLNRDGDGDADADADGDAGGDAGGEGQASLVVENYGKGLPPKFPGVGLGVGATRKKRVRFSAPMILGSYPAFGDGVEADTHMQTHTTTRTRGGNSKVPVPCRVSWSGNPNLEMKGGEDDDCGVEREVGDDTRFELRDGLVDANSKGDQDELDGCGGGKYKEKGAVAVLNDGGGEVEGGGSMEGSEGGGVSGGVDAEKCIRSREADTATATHYGYADSRTSDVGRCLPDSRVVLTKSPDSVSLAGSVDSEGDDDGPHNHEVGMIRSEASRSGSGLDIHLAAAACAEPENHNNIEINTNTNTPISSPKATSPPNHPPPLFIPPPPQYRQSDVTVDRLAEIWSAEVQKVYGETEGRVWGALVDLTRKSRRLGVGLRLGVAERGVVPATVRHQEGFSSSRRCIGWVGCGAEEGMGRWDTMMRGLDETILALLSGLSALTTSEPTNRALNLVAMGPRDVKVERQAGGGAEASGTVFEKCLEELDALLDQTQHPEDRLQVHNNEPSLLFPPFSTPLPTTTCTNDTRNDDHNLNRGIGMVSELTSEKKEDIHRNGGVEHEDGESEVRKGVRVDPGGIGNQDSEIIPDNVVQQPGMHKSQSQTSEENSKYKQLKVLSK